MRKDDDTYNLIEAAMNGDVHLVAQYIPTANATIQGNRALRQAVHRGHNACVRLLLPVSNLSDDVAYEDLILSAIDHGHTECVKTLLSAPNLPFNPYLSVMYYLMRAVSHERIDLVRFFIPKALKKIESDERYQYKIIQSSILKPHEEIFQELLVFSDPQLAWEDLQRKGHTKEECFLVVDHLERVRQKNSITNAIEHNFPHSSSRKI